MKIPESLKEHVAMAMTPTMMTATISLLIKHEDDKARAYIDTRGNITAGVGHNLTSRDIAEDIRQRWVKEDITEFYTDLCAFDWFPKLCEARQIALIDMSFMGWKSFLGFTDMIACLAKNDFSGAAHEVLRSDYAKEVGSRAQDIADILE